MAIIVLPQWNSDNFEQIADCAWAHGCPEGISSKWYDLRSDALEAETSQFELEQSTVKVFGEDEIPSFIRQYCKDATSVLHEFREQQELLRKFIF